LRRKNFLGGFNELKVIPKNCFSHNKMIPTKVFLTRGVGRHKEKLASFEHALRNAKIEKFNLVKVSSIWPPGAVEVAADEGLKYLTPGEIVFCVLSENYSNEKNRMISAAVGCAKPADESHYGYLSEHHDYGKMEEEVGDYAEDLAAQMLASTLGIPFDVNANYDERKQVFIISGKIIETKNMTATAVVEKNGEWTTVVAAAMFIP
jgi:arginine decarboxylase